MLATSRPETLTKEKLYASGVAQPVSMNFAILKRSNAMKPLVLPQISINGSPKERLVEQQCNVMAALSTVQEAMQMASPNGRDYQHRPAELQPALEAWSQRWVMIDDLRKEIEAHAIAIQESGQ